MGGGNFGIFRNAGIHVGFEQNMTEAGFIGTIQNVNGVGIPTEGAALTYRDGMLLIDEFSAITSAMKVQYNTQLDSQLLSALDHGKVFKRLGGGKIEYTTNLSLWAGVQPARYDLSSGLGRRMCFLVFLPTKYDNESLLIAMHKARNRKPDLAGMNTLWAKVNALIKDMDNIEAVTFDDSVLKKYQELKLFSYEGNYFDRLLIGWHLATYGPEKHIHLSCTGKEINELIMREKTWRDDIAKGIDYIQMVKIIRACGVEIDNGKEGIRYEIPKSILVDEAIMVGWNAQQVHAMITEMMKFGMVGMKSGRVVLEG